MCVVFKKSYGEFIFLTIVPYTVDQTFIIFNAVILDFKMAAIVKHYLSRENQTPLKIATD